MVPRDHLQWVREHQIQQGLMQCLCLSYDSARSECRVEDRDELIARPPIQPNHLSSRGILGASGHQLKFIRAILGSSEESSSLSFQQDIESESEPPRVWEEARLFSFFQFCWAQVGFRLHITISLSLHMRLSYF
jgi:hypothetical protein